MNVFPSGHVRGGGGAHLLVGAGPRGDQGSGLGVAAASLTFDPEEPGRRQRVRTWGGSPQTLESEAQAPLLGRKDEISWSRGSGLTLTAAFVSSGDSGARNSEQNQNKLEKGQLKFLIK